MYGYVKLHSGTKNSIKRNYKKYYCTLCRSLEENYGQKSRFLLSFDMTFLLVLFADENYVKEISKVGCIKKDDKLKNVLNQQISKDIATFSILLATVKLDDDIYDDNDLKAKIIKKLFSKQIKLAKQNSPNMYEILTSEYAKIRELEKKGKDIISIENQFANMMVKVGKKCFGMKDNSRISILEMAAKWIYFIDAVDDIDDNIKEKTFNPYSEYGSFENMLNTKYKELGLHFQELYKGVNRLKGGENAEIINHMIFSCVPHQTVRVLEKKRRKK